MLIKFKIVFITCLLLSGCIERNTDKGNESITDTQKIFTEEMETIFDDFKPHDINYYNSVGAEYLIFKVGYQKMNLKHLDILRNTKINDKGWVYLNTQNSSIIFCRNHYQLEISVPRVLMESDDLNEGDILKQNESEWNITFYKPKKIKTACSV